MSELQQSVQESVESKPRMYYFGPWDRAGHYFFDENGRQVWEDRLHGFPFGHDGNRVPVDGCLQPGCLKQSNGHWKREGPHVDVEGLALLHHIQGWTALCFWDRSVDTRGACNSNYFAEGHFSFDEMVEMARKRFAKRWSKMQFEVVLQGSS